MASPPMIVQAVANAILILGLLLLNWNIGDILLVFWLETAIICFYSLLLIAFVERWKFLIIGPLAGVVFAYLLFFLLVFVEAISMELPRVVSGEYQKRDFVEVARHLLPALVAFFISHGLSFLLDFLGKRRYLTSASRDVAVRFLRHLIPLGSAAVLAIFVVTVFGNNVILFAVVLLAKIALDYLICLSEANEPGL